MAGLIQLLKKEEISYLPIDHKETSLFFHLISGLYEQSSIILISNKGFEVMLPPQTPQRTGYPGYGSHHGYCRRYQYGCP
ncbi:MAG: ATP-binding protein [Lachnospiraceae bacterium]|nr:ATP-binding protein [Lachnospiraceae bacterium]